MIVSISPSKAKGAMMAPPSKSMAHRLLICAGLCRGTSRILGVETSEDVLATLDCLEALGAEYTYENGTVTIRGIDPFSNKDGAILPCRECGSTLRFFVPIAWLGDSDVTFTGSEKLMSRPLSVYEDLSRENGFSYEASKGALKIKGQLKSGIYEVPGNISSQFISGLLFALPLCAGDSEIRLIPPVESLSYIHMTVEALEQFGVHVTLDGNTLKIKGSQCYEEKDMMVEGDWSNAAFFEALNELGSRVELSGLREDSLQGDKIYRKLFKALSTGCPTISLADCPDIGPILIALAALKEGAVLKDTRRLSIKECDRGKAMQEEMAKLGAKIEVRDNEIIVHKTELHAPNDMIQSHNDHRIAMSMAVVLSVHGGSIEGAQAVRKSLPDFYERLNHLGVEVIKNDGMDQ